ADKGKMDAFNLGDSRCNVAPYPCYITGTSTLAPNYWALAQNFVLNDATFSSEEGASYVNHLMSVSGAAGPDIPHSATTNPRLSSGSSTHYWGCDAPSDTFTILLNGTK